VQVSDEEPYFHRGHRCVASDTEARGAKSAQSGIAQRKVPIMTDHDLPPELRHRRSRPEALPLELPLDDEVLPPILNPDLASVDQQRNPEPYLRRS
jgi:hypothetical protein